MSCWIRLFRTAFITSRHCRDCMVTQTWFSSKATKIIIVHVWSFGTLFCSVTSKFLLEEKADFRETFIANGSKGATSCYSNCWTLTLLFSTLMHGYVRHQKNCMQLWDKHFLYSQYFLVSWHGKFCLGTFIAGDSES